MKERKNAKSYAQAGESSGIERLHRREEAMKRGLREQVAEVAGILEVGISIIVLIGMLASVLSVLRSIPQMANDDGTASFQMFLSEAMNLVIGIEFIKMLAKHSPGSALEVLLYAIARHMIIGNGSAVDNLFGVAAISLIFLVRKFCFVPAFGATLPGGKHALDVLEVAAAPDDEDMPLSDQEPV